MPRVLTVTVVLKESEFAYAGRLAAVIREKLKADAVEARVEVFKVSVPERA